MSALHDIFKEEIPAQRGSRWVRRRNNEMTVRYLLEESFEGAFFGREFWSQIERETERPLPGWEAKWRPIL